MEALLIVGLIIAALSLLDVLALELGGESRPDWLDPREPSRLNV